MSQKLASDHLRALREAGMVDARRDGKMLMYRLTVEGQRLLAATLDHGSSVPA